VRSCPVFRAVVFVGDGQAMPGIGLKNTRGPLVWSAYDHRRGTVNAIERAGRWPRRASMRVEEVAGVPEGLRRAYLASLPEPQEFYVEALVRAGRTLVVRPDEDTEIVGYAVVADATIVEFYAPNSSLAAVPAMFDAVLDDSGAERALCKTFDPLMVTAAANRPARTRTSGYLFRTILDPGFVADPEVQVRVASSDDVEAVWSIHDGFFDDRDEIGRYVADGRLFLYETIGVELLGCGILARIIPGRDAVDVGMVVASAHRRRGTGSYIVAHLKDYCLRSGDRPVCGCSADNTGSRRALENAGFATRHSLIEFTY
jgi:GNAT superfamily N-acetyltransferase